MNRPNGVIEQYGMRETFTRCKVRPEMFYDPATTGCLDAPAFGVTGSHHSVDGEAFHAGTLGKITDGEYMR